MKDLDGQPQNCIDTIRCRPAVKGLRQSGLHEAMLRLGQMRESIELTHMHVQDSQQAAWESQQLLARLRRDGF